MIYKHVITLLHVSTLFRPSSGRYNSTFVLINVECLPEEYRKMPKHEGGLPQVVYHCIILLSPFTNMVLSPGGRHMAHIENHYSTVTIQSHNTAVRQETSVNPFLNEPYVTSTVHHVLFHHLLANSCALHRVQGCWYVLARPDWKTTESSPFFVRRGGHCCRVDLVGRTTFWFFFWVACKS